MIVLVEGLGRCGKSTLAQKLRLDLPGFEYIHFSVPDREDVEAFFQDRIQEYFKQGQDNLIIDRLHLSNYAYGTQFGPYVLTDFEWWRLDHWLAQMPNLCIMLCDNPISIARRMNTTRLNDPTKRVLNYDEIGPIQNRFNQALGRSNFNPKGSYTLDQIIDISTGEGMPLYSRFLDYIRAHK